jgi:hypothetical protein
MFACARSRILILIIEPSTFAAQAVLARRFVEASVGNIAGLQEAVHKPTLMTNSRNAVLIIFASLHLYRFFARA